MLSAPGRKRRPRADIIATFHAFDDRIPAIDQDFCTLLFGFGDKSFDSSLCSRRNDGAQVFTGNDFAHLFDHFCDDMIDRTDACAVIFFFQV